MKIKALFILILVAFLLAGCTSQRILEDARKNSSAPEANVESNATEKKDDFQSSLKSVQTGGFQFVYSFRRIDGGVFVGEDKRFLKENSPRDTNQWVLTSDDKAVIAGTNYNFTQENFDNLQKRFVITDHTYISNKSNK